MLGATLHLAAGMKSVKNADLQVQVDLFIDTQGSIGAEISQGKPWIEPFGIKGIRLENWSATFAMPITDIIPTTIGFSGKICIVGICAEAVLFYQRLPLAFLVCHVLKLFQIHEQIFNQACV